MNCPKCEKEMTAGYLSSGAKGSLFWARNEYFQNKLANFFTERDAIKNGGIHIPVGNGVINNRTKAWACESCKFVLIDCN
jgi:hypothetical protein